MTQPWSSPIEPFKRLQVTNGLPMDADLWNVAHDYHRRRQDAHYQAFNQSGIIAGLGVRIISAPLDVEPQYRNSPWVEIQPGVAINTFGNFIVLAKPEIFRIAGQASREMLTEYLVISYVDPDKLVKQESNPSPGTLSQKINNPASSLPKGVVVEQLRICEKDQPPIDGEVELCRMRFRPANGVLQLSQPADVFAPGDNTLDFSYRVQARSRSQAVVQVAQAFYDQSKREQRDQDEARLSSLLRSVEALYPAIAAKQISQINLSRESEKITPLGLPTNPGAHISELLNRLLTQQETIDPGIRSDMLQLMRELSDVIQGQSDLSTQNDILQLISQLSETTTNSIGVNQLEAALDKSVRQTSGLLKELLRYDLIYTRMTDEESLLESAQDELKQYLLAGGVLLIEASLKEKEIGQKIEELINLKQELQIAIEQSETTIDSLISTKNTAKIQEYQTIQNQLHASLNAVQSKLKRSIEEFCHDFKDFAQRHLNQPLEDLEDLIQKQPDHPLRSQPFLFSALPVIKGQPIKILIGGGIIFVLGNLSSAWGIDSRSLLPRETIRTAQEMGINILYFAHRRKQMTQLLTHTAG